MKAAGPGRSLRFRLFLLAASGLLPLAIVALVVLAYVTSERERDARDTALAVSRALATAVDAELGATVSVLQSLALSDELAPAQLRQFHALARRVAEAQGWRAIILADAGGRILLSSSDEPEASGQAPVDIASMQQAIQGREPVVGNVARGPRGVAAFAVRLRVERSGQLTYVLSAVIPTEHILAVLMRQQVPATSVVSVFDRNLLRVARSRPHAGERPAPSLQALLEKGEPEGTGNTTTLEGFRSHTGYARLQHWGWVVATGISAEDASAGLYGVLGAVGAGLLASLGLAAFLAWYFARDVTEPIDALKVAAGALGRGEPVRLPHLDVAELQDVGAALALASTDRDRAAQERRAGEAERETLLARATQALQQAEEAGRSKDEFLAMLGHELRNPLAPMATALHLMARKGDPGTLREREVMERQVTHMKRLVDDLLDVSRITGKRLEMRMQPLRLADLVRHAAQAAQPVLGLRRLELQLPDAADALWVNADEVRLSQVLNNLIGNAIKFTGTEGRITLALATAGDAAEITVSDDGVGMPPEVLEHVFDLFYQAPQGADRSRGGLGLGLAIVRSLIEMHGGQVSASSAGADGGSTFTVRLPLAPPPPQAAAAAGVAATEAVQGRVLLVDDNQDAADTAAALLELSGYEVQVAYDPGVALSLLDRFAPDVAVLDIGLPGMSGYELAARVRVHPNGRNCYLVALTGYGTAADITRARAAGFRQHLVKPAAPDALLEAIRHGLRENTDRRAP
ncbi:hybrid sensor histidine kinase/response regulator [Ramlibacter alkalitolerans]|uniref:histidine kinase n=1 Tax=Ramlibacter alkalitolerans TaxID=2039631 RepID=A0ABS1JWE0_9BURK|nr:ATP-binding protein [Ramlibacter alkalitolerans]MBL0428534.1 response regulator [Ramlibacter alkalitolerans]